MTMSDDELKDYEQDPNVEGQEALADKVKEVGRFAAMEGEDNAIASSDGAFAGVSDEYREYAHPNFEPMYAEGGPEEELEDRIAKSNADLAAQATTGDTRFGYNPRVVHPSEARQPSADLIDQNRKIMQKQAGK